MNIRGAILLIVLGVPSLALVLFGPRQTEEVPAERMVLQYWEKWSGIEAQPMKRIVARFNETVGADRGIWVKYCAISNVEQRMLIATAGGDPPDVAGVFDHVVPQFAEQGALLVLDELVAQHGIDSVKFKPFLWDIGVYQDKVYALPSTPYTVALHYNRRLFREAGLDPDDPPETIAELDECARKLTVYNDEGRIVQAGFMPAPALLGWWHWVWPCYFNCRLWDGEKYRLETPEGLEALRWLARRRHETGIGAALDFEGTAGAIEGTQNPFISERMAMVLQGPWVANWVRSFNPGLDYGVVNFPSVSKEQRNTFVSADVFVIPKGASHLQEAMVFLKYVLQQEVMEELCKEQCKISPYVEPSPVFFDGHPNPHIRVFDEMAMSEYAFGHPQMPTFKQVSKEMLFMLESILQGVRSPEQAASDTQKKVDEIVADYNHMAERRRIAEGAR